MAKTTVEECLNLNINNLNRDSKGQTCLKPGLSGTIDWKDGKNRIGVTTYHNNETGLLFLRLDFTNKGENIRQEVPITLTGMPTGGKRPWFICSVNRDGVFCGRRVGKLFLPSYGKLFACRHCYDLAYKSQQEWINPRSKALFKSIQMLGALEWSARQGKATRRRVYESLNKDNKLYRNLKKAGLLPDGYEETD
ncbi:MAG: hypothetical protein GY841_23865 [FCB group bacterium]|nr:hypothetical protein [FCB group bacterium]